MKTLTALIPLTPVLGTAVAEATDISGVITTTLTITEHSQLVGDVTCDVPGAPCIAFGAADIVLNLNGFTMTGQGERNSCPSPVSSEHAIRTSGQNGVAIQGPGLVRRFRSVGIVVDSDNSQVSHVVVASVCRNGITVGGFGNEVVANFVVRAALSDGFMDGIAVLGSGGHSILRNEVIGASGLEAQGGSCPSPPEPGPCRGGHGIFVGSTDNLIQNNNASGNPGAGIFLGNGATGSTTDGTPLSGTSSSTTSSTTMLPARTRTRTTCARCPVAPALPLVRLVQTPQAIPRRRTSRGGSLTLRGPIALMLAIATVACGGGSPSGPTSSTPTPAPAPMPAPAPAAPGQRATTDRPDDISGSQVHVVYMLPADGVDQSLDTNGTVAGAVEWARSWFSGQTGGRRVRFDTAQGALDVTFLRTTRSDAEYVSMGNRIRDGVAADLAAAGFATPTKIYSVFFGGGSPRHGSIPCGQGARPGTMSALYLACLLERSDIQPLIAVHGLAKILGMGAITKSFTTSAPFPTARRTTWIRGMRPTIRATSWSRPFRVSSTPTETPGSFRCWTPVATTITSTPTAVARTSPGALCSSSAATAT